MFVSDYATQYNDVDLPCSREDTHKLLVGLERLTELEPEIHLVKVLEIGSERGKMVRIVPLPRRSL